jgi:polyphosphate glucokinase
MSAQPAPSTNRRATARPRAAGRPRTLSIDIGGTGLKAAVLDHRGRMTTERVRIPTPDDAPPPVLLPALDELIAQLTGFDRVSVGFPGVIRDGRVLTAHNLGTEAWRGYRLGAALEERWGKPVRVANDADVQGLGVVRGKGVEMVITLGTGLGSALFENGRLLPHLEFAHHPIAKGKTYEQYLGDEALKKIGRKRWNRRIERAIGHLRRLVTFDRLYIGGGNARLIRFTPDRDVRVVSNRAGILGGIALWR